MEHAPNTKFLKEISEKLNKTGIPIYYKLPGPEIIEPFMLLAITLTMIQKVQSLVLQ